MIRIATNIDQSRKLIELGLDPKTADCRHVFCCTVQKEDIYQLELGEPNADEETVPAWSLTTLLELMPAEEGDRPIIEKIRPGEYTCKYLDTEEKAVFIRKFGDIPVDAAYNMMCHLLEKGFIKPGTSL
jgi:hypothetical protein